MPEFAVRRGAKIEMQPAEELFSATSVLQFIPAPVLRKVIADAAGRLWVMTLRGERFGESYLVVSSAVRPFEVHPGDHAHWRVRVVRPQTNVGANGPEPGYLVEMRSAGGVTTLWMPEADMATLEEQPDPEEDELPGGAKARGVTLALAALWPDGIPEGLAGKDRNREVRAWLEQYGHSVPADLERAIQRALATAADRKVQKRMTS